MKLGAIFDMDGLLFDTELVYNKEWYHCASTYGLSINPAMLDELRGTSGVIMNAIVNKYLPDIDAQMLTDEVFIHAKRSLSKHVPIKVGAVELLSYLKVNGVKLAIASSAPMELIQNNLKVAGMASYFDVVVSGQDVKDSKPEPDIFLLAAKKLGLNVSECYVLEDGINGVYAGVRAGCSTIMVPDLVPPTQEQYKLCIGIYTNLIDVMKAMKQEIC